MMSSYLNYMQYIPEMIYTLVSRFVAYSPVLLPVVFSHTHQGYFMNTGAIIQLSQCQWNNSEECKQACCVDNQKLIIKH